MSCFPGYCGADIKAVCAEAALCALRRRYPQIYASSQKLQLDVASISLEGRDFLAAMRKTVPAAHRAVSSPAKALTPVVRPLLAGPLASVLGTLRKLFPHAELGLRGPRGPSEMGGSPGSDRAALLLGCASMRLVGLRMAFRLFEIF